MCRVNAAEQHLAEVDLEAAFLDFEETDPPFARAYCCLERADRGRAVGTSPRVRGAPM
jgi:hypothetical protein